MRYVIVSLLFILGLLLVLGSFLAAYSGDATQDKDNNGNCEYSNQQP